jgi:hypothetical protein
VPCNAVMRECYGTVIVRMSQCDPSAWWPLLLVAATQPPLYASWRAGNRLHCETVCEIWQEAREALPRSPAGWRQIVRPPAVRLARRWVHHMQLGAARQSTLVSLSCALRLRQRVVHVRL